MLLSVYRLVKMMASSLNDGKKTAGDFIDFKKAFDLVNHKILLMK